MAYLPITLGISRAVPLRAGASGKGKRGGQAAAPPPSPGTKKIPAELKKQVLERDGYACQYCGFESRKYQEVHTKNNNPADHSLDNLVTACLFCHQCFHLEDVGDMTSGTLIWLPDISQADLHHIARAIYVGRISQGPVADAARKTHDILMARREDAVRRLGTDNPYILSTVLRDYLGDAAYALREKKLKGIRLLPLDRRLIKEAELEFNQFPQILAYWRSKDGPFGGKIPGQWLSIYQDVVKAA